MTIELFGIEKRDKEETMDEYYRLWTSDEVGRFLGVNRNTVTKWVRKSHPNYKKEFPKPVIVGRKLKFVAGEIKEYIEMLIKRRQYG